MRPSSLTALIVGLGGLHLLLIGLAILAIMSFSATRGGVEGNGPILGGNTSPGASSSPALGGLYTCDTCRGYPSGSHYSRDSWRWY